MCFLKKKSIYISYDNYVQYIESQNDHLRWITGTFLLLFISSISFIYFTKSATQGSTSS